jgi:simple sugar transport system substrate-binding protein
MLDNTSSPKEEALMSRSEKIDIDPRLRAVARRRFIRNAGLAGVGAPAVTALLSACGSSSSGSGGGSNSQSSDPWPSHPSYRFALINHVTTNSFFVPCRAGAQDACTLLGCSYSWSGSEENIVSQMIDAMDSAIDSKVNGIGLPVVDPTAFNSVTDKALAAGIPTVAYNTSAPTGTGSNVLAYIGQDLELAGQLAGQRILKLVKSGDMVAGMIGVPGSLDEQPRINGAKSVLEPAGVHFVQVGIGATQGPEISAVQAWYQGHQDVKFMYGVGSSEGIAVATAISKLGLAAKGIGGSSWDVGTPALQGVKSGQLAFTIDQQSYLQGFYTIVQLFLYNLTGGLLQPVDTNTGLLFVTRDNVDPYLAKQNRWEGSSGAATVLSPPSAIKV